MNNIYTVRLQKILFILILMMFPALTLNAGKPLEISKNFTLFTSKNLEGYLKPLFTTIEESFNSNLYTSAVYENEWSIALDISGSGLFIPDNQKIYDAMRPEAFGNTDITKTSELRYGEIKDNINGRNLQPTLYGGRSTPVFSSPQYHSDETEYYKTVTYMEGANIDIMSGLPIIQFIAGFPTRTQFRFRFIAFPLMDEMVYYYGLIANQQINEMLGLFKRDPNMGLSVNLAYHNVNRNQGIDIKSWAAGLHFSKSWYNGLTGYTGIQYEGMNGKFVAMKTGIDTTASVNSPYEEVRLGKPLIINLESFTSFRVTAGFSYKLGFAEIHADAAWASQPILTCGVTFWIAKFGRQEEVPEDFEIIEKIETKKEANSEVSK